jgi:hypothetical protein
VWIVYILGVFTDDWSVSEDARWIYWLARMGGLEASIVYKRNWYY